MPFGEVAQDELSDQMILELREGATCADQPYSSFDASEPDVDSSTVWKISPRKVALVIHLSDGRVEFDRLVSEHHVERAEFLVAA